MTVKKGYEGHIPIYTFHKWFDLRICFTILNSYIAILQLVSVCLCHYDDQHYIQNSLDFWMFPNNCECYEPIGPKI